MRTQVLASIVTAIALSGAAVPTRAATILFPDYEGSTGWQLYQHTFTSAFTGYALLGASNGRIQGTYDDDQDSKALFDRVILPGGNTQGFEIETGYAGFGTGATVVSSATALDGATTYSATEGTLFALAWARDQSTAYLAGIHPLVDGEPTTGSWFKIAVAAGAGQTISFDWAFLNGGEQMPDYGTDFAFFALENGGGAIVYKEALAVISDVPVPGAIWLLGSGLVGLAGLGRRRSLSRGRQS